jgi:hypothetical protein
VDPRREEIRNFERKWSIPEISQMIMFLWTGEDGKERGSKAVS